MMTVWTATSLERFFPGEDRPEQYSEKIELFTGRNERESAQILLRGKEEFQILGFRTEGLAQFELSLRAVETIEYSKGGAYPDPLSVKLHRTVEADCTQSLWLTLYTPADVAAGIYSGSIIVETTVGDICVETAVQVFAITIPDSANAAFSMEYWVNTVGFWWRNPHLEKKDFICEQYGCEKYDSRWWKVVGAIADNLRENRINVLFVRTQDLLCDGGSTLGDDGIYRFDWSLFDRFVSFFIERGCVKKLAGFHLVKQTEGKEVYVPLPDESGKLCVQNKALDTAEAKAWLRQFLPALNAHLREKGWLSLWMQHIEDEPAETDSWLTVRKLVAQYMPGVLCHDAIDCQAPAPRLQGAMDLWLPRTDIFEENQAFYAHRLAQGEQRWTYTCCVPNTPNYLNKFIDSPYWQDRLLFWGCFLKGFTGFLHWGYNFWDTEDEWFGLNPNAFFKGDGFITYPDPETGGIKSSTRLENTRDSAEEYELLHLLAEKNPELAFSLAGKLMNNFHDFTWDLQKMIAVRKELLTAAEAAYCEEEKG